MREIYGFSKTDDPDLAAVPFGNRVFAPSGNRPQPCGNFPSLSQADIIY